MVLGFSPTDLRILVLFGCLTFVGLADSQIISPILPELARDFRMDVTDTNQVVTLYWAGAALASIVTGPLLDYYGRKSVLLLGIGLAASANCVAAGIDLFTPVLCCRFLVGLGTSLASTAHLAYMGDYFPYAVRGRAMGVITVGFFAGFTFGVPLGGLVANALSWRWTFRLFATLMGFVLIGCLAALPPLPPQRSPMIGRLLIRDMLDLHRRLRPMLAMLLYACIGASTTGFVAYAGEWLFRRFDYSIPARSQIFFWGGLASLLVSPVAGIWADRAGKRIPAVVGTGLICLAMMLAPSLPGSPLVIYPALMLLAAGFSLRQSPLLTLVTEIVPARRRGTFLALKNAWTQIGAALGNFLAGILYKRGGYQYVAGFSSILTGVTLVILATRLLEPGHERNGA